MKQFKRTLVTSALPYANGPVHIGHLAGVYVPADIYVRYLRLRGEEVLFVGGSDEHGVPVTIRAKKEGITPQDVVDRYHALIRIGSSTASRKLSAMTLWRRSIRAGLAAGRTGPCGLTRRG